MMMTKIGMMVMITSMPVASLWGLSRYPISRLLTNGRPIGQV
jgi:hypothetical protein